MAGLMKVTKESDFLGAWMNQTSKRGMNGIPVRGDFELASVPRKSNFDLERYIFRHKPSGKDILVMFPVPRSRKVEFHTPGNVDDAGRPTTIRPFDVLLIDTRSETVRLILESLVL